MPADTLRARATTLEAIPPAERAPLWGVPFAVKGNIDVAGLPAAPEGEYYEGWLHAEETGEWVSVGTFHMRGGDDHVELWSGVPVDRYPTLTVTLQEEGAGQESSGRVVLSGDVRG